MSEGPTVEGVAKNLSEGRLGMPAQDRRPTAKPKGAKMTDEELRESLQGLFGAGAMVFALRGDEFCSGHMLQNSHVAIEPSLKFSQHNKQMRSILEALVQGGVYAEFLFGIFMFAAPMLKHHGVKIVGLDEFLAFMGYQIAQEEAEAGAADPEAATVTAEEAA